MTKTEIGIWAIILCMISVFLLESCSSLSYDHKEFDYSTGQIRIRHRTFGFTQSTNYKHTWIEQYAPIAQAPDWRLMGYPNSPSAPRINTKSGQLYSLIHTMGTMLDDYSADKPTHKLVADYIFDLLSRTQTDPSIHYDVVDNFLYFTDIFPYPDDLYGTVTYEQVLELIGQCTTPSDPPTISP